MNRRSFLTSVAGSAAMTGLGKAVAAQGPSGAARAPEVRVAQLTDTHVFTDLDCPAHMRAFLARFRAVAGTSDVILHTGDVIYDALAADREDVRRQWALWREFARELPKPPQYSIGNHDVWGKGPEADALYGKKWAMDVLELTNRFYSFTQGRWKFIVLDSVHAIPQGWYTARLDDEQFFWLESELTRTPATQPILVVSHIPILSVSIFDWATVEGNVWTFRDSWMHRDSHQIQALLRRHPNVKLCLSGHLHLTDELTYDGITYLGCGAVSAEGWQNATFHQTPCGFATIDLFADGSFQRTYHRYDW